MILFDFIRENMWGNLIMKNKSLLLVTVLLVLSLMGCNSNEITDYKGKSTISNSIATVEESSYTEKLISDDNGFQDSESLIPLSKVTCCKSFSEGLAWIRDSNTVYCADKEGNVILSYKNSNNNLSDVNSFSNGYATISQKYNEKTRRIIVIDKSGNMCSKYDFNDSLQYVMSKDGYTITEEHKKDFDSDYFEYSVYSPTKELIHRIETIDPRELSVKYVGKATFSFGSINGTTNETIHETYFAEKNKSVEVFCEGFFYEDIAFLNEGTSEEGSHHEIFKFLDLDGNISSVDIPSEYGWIWFNNGIVKDDYFFCYSKRSELILSYNTNTKELKKYDASSNRYFDRIDWDKLNQYLYVNNGLIVLPMIGTDKKSYVSVVDPEFNTIIEPQRINESSVSISIGKGFSHSYDCDRYVFYPSSGGSEIYDNNGNVVFTSDEKNYNVVNKYQENTAIVNAVPLNNTNNSAPDICIKDIVYATSEIFVTDPKNDNNLYIDINGESLFHELKLCQDIKVIEFE